VGAAARATVEISAHNRMFLKSLIKLDLNYQGLPPDRNRIFFISSGFLSAFNPFDFHSARVLLKTVVK